MRDGSKAAVLAVAVLAIGGCTVRTADSTDSTAKAPTRELVAWVDDVCNLTKWLADTQETGKRLASTTAADESTESEVNSYLNTASTYVDTMADEFAALPPVDIAGTDELADGFATALNNVRSEVTNQTADPESVHSMPLQDKLNRAARVADLFNSVRPAGPDLPELMRRSPDLAAAHELAPRCHP
ncbi:hypothetical protein MOQ72_38015 [Saccharopolyspora sp. K220]|uniref:hypothetical protein n=1 Tax=Saccharopolyspora soli TaxID=2926618 RepID=UPI001F590E77|nr:hypothetical protein [Saccharopolyspora soli]MCI2423232.1 hypothetical protein [Saccharopolyspora soli]